MSNATKPIVVIDTQIFLRATLNPRSLPARLLFELGHLFILAVSPEIRAEIVDVLNRPKLREKFSGLTDVSVATTLSIVDAGNLIELTDIPAVSRDPKDDIFLATAVEAKATYIVSEDNDLLVLNPYGGVKILNALAFLKVLLELEEKSEE